MLTAVAGCASSNGSLTESQRALLLADFARGEARMDCRAGCSYTWGYSRRELQILYASGRWSQLAQRTLEIGFDSDLSWYYLGRAAFELGKHDAATTYLRISAALSSTSRTCNRLLSDCDGISLPAEANALLGQAATRTSPANVDPADTTLLRGILANRNFLSPQKAAAMSAVTNKDFATANAILEPMAASGDVFAQFVLGLLAKTGFDGYPLQPERAFQNLALASNNAAWKDQDDIWVARTSIWSAQYQLAVMFRDGSGVAKNSSEALAWASIAAARGSNSGQRTAKTLTEKMSPAQIARGLIAADRYSADRLNGAILIDGRPAKDRSVDCAKLTQQIADAQGLKSEGAAARASARFRELVLMGKWPSATVLYPSGTVAMDDIERRLRGLQDIQRVNSCPSGPPEI
jgi:TPR repeat protein